MCDRRETECLVSSLSYSVSLENSETESMYLIVESDRYCMTVDEEAGFELIRNRLSEPVNNAASSFVLIPIPNHE